MLNTYFATMIDLVHSYSGSVIKFGGDAMTCRFPGDTNGLLHACGCALAMQEEMKSFCAVETECGTYSLQMKIGISGGPVFSLSVGSPEEGLEYVLAGHDV